MYINKTSCNEKCELPLHCFLTILFWNRDEADVSEGKGSCYQGELKQ